MNKNTLFSEAMSYIDDSLITESVRADGQQNGKRGVFISLAASAAAVAVIIPVAMTAARTAFPGGLSDADSLSDTGTHGVTIDEVSPATDPGFIDTDPLPEGEGPEVYLHPTVEELREMDNIPDLVPDLVPNYLPDGYVFNYVDLLMDGDDFFFCKARLIDNRNNIIERAEEKYGSDRFAAVSGNSSSIEFTISRKRDGEVLTITADGSPFACTETIVIREDYSQYIGFNELTPEIIEESRTECFDYDPAMRGYLYDVFLDAGEYKVHYRYSLCGDAEALSAEELYSVITSCEYMKK